MRRRQRIISFSGSSDYFSKVPLKSSVQKTHFRILFVNGLEICCLLAYQSTRSGKFVLATDL